MAVLTANEIDSRLELEIAFTKVYSVQYRKRNVARSNPLVTATDAYNVSTFCPWSSGPMTAMLTVVGVVMWEFYYSINFLMIRGKNIDININSSIDNTG
jgi:hypothetical protein